MGMAPGLRKHALARIDEDNRRIRGRGAGHHIARVLCMPRRVGDDVIASWRGEGAVGHVDGDFLRALSRRAVEQKALDQRALAIVRAAASEDPQQVRHQKVPSRFFASIEKCRGSYRFCG